MVKLEHTNNEGFIHHANGFIDFPPVPCMAVDGDIVAYRTAAVCETHFEGAAYAIIDSTIRDIINETKITRLRIYLSGKDNFRYKIGVTKPYKGNRATMVRPQYLQACKDYLIEKYNAIVIEGFEADDGIATDMTVNGAFHCGIDKDMLQIPGKHYNYVKKEWQTVTKEEAEIILYRQILMGDNSDNIPGLPRVGAAIAERTIQDYETAREDAQAMYEETVRMKMPDVDWQTYFLEQESLVTMITDVDIDFDQYYEGKVFTDGFEAQEGGLENDKPKLEPRL